MRADLDSANVEANIVAAARRLLSQLVSTREEAERVRRLSPALAPIPRRTPACTACICPAR